MKFQIERQCDPAYPCQTMAREGFTAGLICGAALLAVGVAAGRWSKAEEKTDRPVPGRYQATVSADGHTVVLLDTTTQAATARFVVRGRLMEGDAMFDKREERGRFALSLSPDKSIYAVSDTFTGESLIYKQGDIFIPEAIGHIGPFWVETSKPALQSLSDKSIMAVTDRLRQRPPASSPEVE